MAKTTLRPAIPTKPRAILCGKLQSQEFTDGVYALVDALLEAKAIQRDDHPTSHQMIATVVERITPLIDQGGDTKAGAIAALAHWVVICMEGCVPHADGWLPLESTYDGETPDAYDDPHPLASFFEVAGTPVTVTPDLLARRWTNGPEWQSSESVSVDLVRAIGKPISHKRFDKLRAKTEPRPRL